MPSQLVDDCIRMDLLYRLRWNLLADLHDVETVWGPKNEEKIIPFFDHSSADAEFGVPSVSRIEVKSRECDEKFQLSYDSEPGRTAIDLRPHLSFKTRTEDSLH
jgi:hypothetical protein